MDLATCLSACANATSTLVDCSTACFVAAGWDYPDTLPGTVHFPTYAAVLISALLVGFSGLFSGLTLGLLSLDLVGLRILEKAGEANEKKCARIIIPVRQQGNLLLCTLLLGNTLANSAISILLTDVTSGTVGLIVSTFTILILGEIIPQAACSKHRLEVGSRSIHIVRFFIFLFYPVCKPISWCLDKALGHDIGTVYSQDELKRLIDIHVEDPTAQKESGLTADDHRLITGVFEYKDKKVCDCMTKLENSFMLEKTMKLNFQTLSKIYISGCSRIPIYDSDRNNIIGILFVKDLILVDPDDELEISTVMAFRGRTVGRVYDNVTLDKVFTKFLTSANHMLIAHAPPDELGDGDTGPVTATPVTGLITLEDVLEEMINFEIYDESDAADQLMSERRKGQHGRTHRQDVSIYLNLFEHKMKGPKLSPPEVQAIYAFLAFNVEEFRSLATSDVAFRGLVRTAEVLERVDPLEIDGHSASGVSVDDYGDRFWEYSMQHGQLLYQRGVPCSYFTLILQGKVLIRTGAEGFELELGPWSHLANKALVQDYYVPDFDAIALPPTRVLRIHRAGYLAALDASRLEQAREFQAVKQHVRMAAQDGGSLLESSPPVASNPAAVQSGPWDRRDAQDFGPPRTGIAAMELARFSNGTTTPDAYGLEYVAEETHEDAPPGDEHHRARNHKGFNPKALDSFEQRHLQPRPIKRTTADSTESGPTGGQLPSGFQGPHRGSSASLSEQYMSYGGQAADGCLAPHGSGEVTDSDAEAAADAATDRVHHREGYASSKANEGRRHAQHTTSEIMPAPDVSQHRTRVSWDDATPAANGGHHSQPPSRYAQDMAPSRSSSQHRPAASAPPQHDGHDAGMGRAHSSMSRGSSASIRMDVMQSRSLSQHPSMPRAGAPSAPAQHDVHHHASAPQIFSPTPTPQESPHAAVPQKSRPTSLQQSWSLSSPPGSTSPQQNPLRQANGQSSPTGAPGGLQSFPSSSTSNGSNTQHSHPVAAAAAAQHSIAVQQKPQSSWDISQYNLGASKPKNPPMAEGGLFEDLIPVGSLHSHPSPHPPHVTPTPQPLAQHSSAPHHDSKPSGFAGNFASLVHRPSDPLSQPGQPHPPIPIISPPKADKPHQPGTPSGQSPPPHVIQPPPPAHTSSQRSNPNPASPLLTSPFSCAPPPASNVRAPSIAAVSATSPETVSNARPSAAPRPQRSASGKEEAARVGLQDVLQAAFRTVESDDDSEDLARGAEEGVLPLLDADELTRARRAKNHS